MHEIDSLSIFVGTGDCNGNCPHCAGKVHRQYAPKADGILDKDLIYSTMKQCYEKGARYLTISSSGEPTLSPLSVSKTLDIVNQCKKEGIVYSPVNLYSNGIRIGESEEFCKKYLGAWKEKGLKTIYVTVHDTDERKNANVYGIENYPKLENIVQRIHDAGLLMRANLVLNKNSIGTLEKFSYSVNELNRIGVDTISAWPLRGLDDKVDKVNSPSKEELDKIEDWIDKNSELAKKIRLLRENSRILYQTNRKLTLFPDGTLSSTWCNY